METTNTIRIPNPSRELVAFMKGAQQQKEGAHEKKSVRNIVNWFTGNGIINEVNDRIEHSRYW